MLGLRLVYDVYKELGEVDRRRIGCRVFNFQIYFTLALRLQETNGGV